MKGALVFLAVFIVVTLVCLEATNIPPGVQIYQALNVPSVDYPVLGIPATTLIIAVFNGVVYGVIVWLIYTVAARATKKEKTTTVQQTQKTQ